MRTRTNLIIDVLALVTYLFAANPKVTGIVGHEWISLGFAFVALVHLALHGHWVARTVRRFAGRLAGTSRLNLIVAALTGVAVTSVIVSGFVVSQTLAGLLGWATATGGIWRSVHAVSAAAVLLTGGLHVALHRSWIASAVRLHVIAPIARSWTGAAEARRSTRAVAWGVPAVLAAGLIVLAGLSIAGFGTAADAATAAGSSSATSTGTLTCPRTGCTAATCHATAGGSGTASGPGGTGVRTPGGRG